MAVRVRWPYLVLTMSCAPHLPDAPRSALPPPPADSAIAPATAAKPVIAPKPALPPPPAPAPKPEAVDLEFLRTKPLGVVTNAAARKNRTNAEILSAICERVVVVASGKLGCDSCVDCPKPSEGEDRRAIEDDLEGLVRGRFLMQFAGEQAVAVMFASLGTGYDYRYFILERKNGRWWVRATALLMGIPLELRVLHAAALPDALMRVVATPGNPGPTEVLSVRFTEEGPDVWSLAIFDKFYRCQASRLAYSRSAARDVNGDRNDDVIIQIADRTKALENAATVQRLLAACPDGEELYVAARERTLVFTQTGRGFRQSRETARLLQMGDDEIEPGKEIWELEPKP